MGCRPLRNDNHMRLSQTLHPSARAPSPATPPQRGHHLKETKLLRRTFASPFSVCPRVKNTSKLSFQLQGQAAVQTTQGEAGAQDSRPQLVSLDSRQPTAAPPAPPTPRHRLGKEELIGNRLWLLVHAPKFSPSQSHPGGIVNLRAVFNKTKATWNYMQVWFSTVHIYLIP